MALTDPGNTGRDGFVEHLNLQLRNDKEIRGVLRDTDRFVQREIAQIPGDSVSEHIRRAQYQQASDSIQRHTDNGWSDIGRIIDGNLGRSAEIAGDGAAELVATLGHGLPDELLAGMQAAADTSGQRVAARIANDIDLAPSVYGNANLTAGHVDRIINESIASGRSAKELAKSVSQYILPTAPGGMSYSAMRLGRTELNNAFHRTNQEIYKNQPWVVGVKWHLSGSHPKPDECNEYADKEIWLPNDVPDKPHPQCLCYTVPCTPDRDVFLNNLLDGDYDDWLVDQGMEPLTDNILAFERIYKVTAEDLIKAREAGKSWATIANEFDLGSPGSARTAWTKLTGTPHTTAPSAARSVTTTAKTVEKKVAKTVEKQVVKPITPTRSQPVWESKGPTRKPVETVKKTTSTRSSKVGKDLSEWVDQQDIRAVERHLSKIMEELPNTGPFSANFEGMDLKVANGVARNTRDFVNDYPAVRARFGGIRISSDIPARGMASADPMSGLVRLHPDYWGKGIKEPEIRVRQNRMKATGFKTTGDPYHTINHELGHMVDFTAEGRDNLYRTRAVSDSLFKHTNVSNESAVRFSHSRGKFADFTAKDEISTKLSSYGASNSYEFVAESFADVRVNGAAARDISKDTVKNIYDVAKRKGRR